MPQKERGLDPGWSKPAVIYGLPVNSFLDSNADRIDDFSGLIDKIEYLESLGLTCLWLLPFFPSSLRDDGYDSSDYRDAHPSFEAQKPYLISRWRWPERLRVG